jgi:hypothetical protein
MSNNINLSTTKMLYQFIDIDCCGNYIFKLHNYDIDYVFDCSDLNIYHIHSNYNLNLTDENNNLIIKDIKPSDLTTINTNDKIFNNNDIDLRNIKILNNNKKYKLIKNNLYYLCFL